MDVTIFEDEKWADFLPLSATRHLGQQILGRSTLIEHLKAGFGDGLGLLGRTHLGPTVRKETKLTYNEGADASVLVINARTNPLADLKRTVKGKSDFALIDRGDLVMAILGKKKLEDVTRADGTLSQAKLRTAAKGMERLETEGRTLFDYPWEILAENGRAIAASMAGRKGNDLSLSPDAEIEEFVAFDPSSGPIVVDKGARIESFSRLSGPCYIGQGTVVRSARVGGGTTIGRECRMGGEVEASIVYPYTNKAHSGYLGHSLVGGWVNMGAGSVTSDLKNTYGSVRVTRGGARLDTGMVKLGPMIGDMAKISIGCMVYGGRSVGVSSHCSGTVDRDVPDFVSFDGLKGESASLELKSVIKTQTRMMERRGLKLTREGASLIRELHERSARPASKRT